jgi:hypothetical protein
VDLLDRRIYLRLSRKSQKIVEGDGFQDLQEWLSLPETRTG